MGLGATHLVLGVSFGFRNYGNMPIKTYYIWGKSTIRKVGQDDLDILKEELNKKPKIPFLSVFGKIHAKFLKRRIKHHG